MDNLNIDRHGRRSRLHYFATNTIDFRIDRPARAYRYRQNYDNNQITTIVLLNLNSTPIIL